MSVRGVIPAVDAGVLLRDLLESCEFMADRCCLSAESAGMSFFGTSCIRLSVAMVCWSRLGLLAVVFVETRVAARSDALSDVLIASMPSLMLATSWSICLKRCPNNFAASSGFAASALRSTKVCRAWICFASAADLIFCALRLLISMSTAFLLSWMAAL